MELQRIHLQIHGDVVINADTHLVHVGLHRHIIRRYGEIQVLGLGQDVFSNRVRRGMLGQPERCLVLNVVVELVIVYVNGNDFETGNRSPPRERRERGWP